MQNVCFSPKNESFEKSWNLSALDRWPFAARNQNCCLQPDKTIIILTTKTILSSESITQIARHISVSMKWSRVHCARDAHRARWNIQNYIARARTDYSASWRDARQEKRGGATDDDAHSIDMRLLLNKYVRTERKAKTIFLYFAKYSDLITAVRQLFSRKTDEVAHWIVIILLVSSRISSRSYEKKIHCPPER